jgi:uncharacterized RDD family membrane protein YckC
MRCPKCQYISFDSGERCRNCGYEFSLTPDSRAIDLPIQTGQEPIGPLGDFTLAIDSRRTDAASAALADTISPLPSKTITSSFDLPLFKERKTPDDAPLVTPAAVPRAPLSVRRSGPGPRPASRSSIEEPVLDLDPPGPSVFGKPLAPVAAEPVERNDDPSSALLGARLVAALLDTAILVAIGSVVLYLTLKVCGLPLARLHVIPPVPFVSFLLLIAGGYFTLFIAAGGQTIGKMAAGIRVVSTDHNHGRVPLGHAILRAAVYFLSALPAGLGFLPALMGADRRAIHDRLADTRVVKA